MAGRSIGVLTAFITANTTQFMKEFDKLDRQIARASASYTKPGAKLALGFLGVQNALSAVTSEVRSVIANIERIPGVPQETVSSIVTLRTNLADAKNWIDRMTAGIIAFGVKAGQAVGVGFAGLMGYKDASGLSRLETPDEIAASKDPAFQDKVTAARSKLVAANKAADFASMSDVQQINALRKDADALRLNSQSNSKNSLEKIDAQIASAEKVSQANAKMAGLRKELEAAEEKSGKAFGDVLAASSMQSPDASLRDLKDGETAVRRKLAELQGGDQNDPENLLKQIKLREQLTTIYERQIPLLEKQKALANEVGETIAGSFEDAVFAGKNLHEMLSGLAMDLARMVFHNMVTAPLARMIGGGLMGIFGGIFGGGKAGGGPVNARTPYLVGEEGPEFFVPGVSGAIIPHGRSMEIAGRAGGDTYMIDARGADASKIRRLEEIIMAINGSIEHRAVGAVISARRRGKMS